MGRKMSKQILAIFDFCETLVDIQSIPPYLELAILHNPSLKQSPQQKIRGIRKILHRLARSIYKRTKFKPFAKYMPKQMPVLSPVRYEALRDLPLEVAERLAQEYAKTKLQKHTNQRVIEKLKWHQAQGHTIAIVSGGLEIYIKYFADIFNIPRQNIIAIELEAKNGILTGQIDGIHTMEYRKLYKLAQMIDLSRFDLEGSYFYSDCPSDIPLLSFVGHPIVIECGKDILWAKILGYEILWRV